MIMNWQRITALLYRYLLIYRRSIARVADIFIWPVSELVMWGFISAYLLRAGTNVPIFVGYFLGALILWDVFFRSQVGVTTNFLEDVWTKNFLNLFASPLRVSEYLTAMLLFSFFRIVIGIGLMSLLAWWWYGFQFFTIGLPLVLFFANLFIMGWSVGIFTVALIIRLGQNAEILAWTLAVFFQPLAAVYYPLAVLPSAAQVLAHLVPASYVFEGMRQLVLDGTFDGSKMLWAVVLNAAYLTISILFFLFIFRNAKKSGRLVRTWQ